MSYTTLTLPRTTDAASVKRANRARTIRTVIARPPHLRGGWCAMFAYVSDGIVVGPFNTRADAQASLAFIRGNGPRPATPTLRSYAAPVGTNGHGKAIGRHLTETCADSCYVKDGDSFVHLCAAAPINPSSHPSRQYPPRDVPNYHAARVDGDREYNDDRLAELWHARQGIAAVRYNRREAAARFAAIRD